MPADDVQFVVISSDGLGSRWELNKYPPSLLRRDSSIIAATLYKDHARRTDDTMILIFSKKSK
jgi:hypothetical protein